MKILISTGSFKDVYTSIESCERFKNIICGDHEVDVAPLCDGGEYTFDILKYYYKDDFSEITVNDVINPYGKNVSSRYAVLGDEAYVISSEILHLNPEEDIYKNPLRLTDYGLGQLVLDAVNKGYKKINLCLGGTSSVGYGMGFAKALGAEFFDLDDKEIDGYMAPESFPNIQRVEWNSEKYTDIIFQVVNDGITRACNLVTVNPLKIGKSFEKEKDSILAKLTEATNHIYEITGLTDNEPFSGNGGAVFYGIKKLFNAEYVKGADYFCDLFMIDSKISKADIVITGEGRYDNPHLKKLPIVVADHAKRQTKRVIFLCGAKDADTEVDKSIDVILSCDDFYVAHPYNDSKYSNEIDMYRELTPVILKEELEKVL